MGRQTLAGDNAGVFPVAPAAYFGITRHSALLHDVIGWADGKSEAGQRLVRAIEPILPNVSYNFV